MNIPQQAVKTHSVKRVSHIYSSFCTTYLIVCLQVSNSLLLLVWKVRRPHIFSVLLLLLSNLVYLFRGSLFLVPLH